MHHSSLKRVALAAFAALFTSACIVVPAENHTAPPPVNNAPPPPPPAYGEQQPPPNNYGQPTNYGQQPPPQGYGQPGTTTVVYYEQPAPEPVAYYESNVVWYYGPHPVTPGNGYGWCPIQGGHTHAYEPYWQDRYDFYSGYYYYLGDPSAYDRTVVYYIYIGAHPNPWGGWCYASGEHHHYYTPRRSDPYRYEGSRWQYSGTYDQTYYSQRSQYDANGHRTQGNAYADHRTYQAAHSTPTRGSSTHETIPANGTHPEAGSMREGNAQTAPMNNHDSNPRDSHENQVVTPPAHENAAHDGHDPLREPAHDTNAHNTPANNNEHPTMLIHGGMPAATPTPAAAPNRMGPGGMAPAATPTPAAAPNRMGPGGGHVAATPTPAPAAGGKTVNVQKPTPTPTPAPKGHLR